uniref:Putative C1q domain containing protein MgC1q51 n=1 Tax=Mytilus galloprovincialis TaxID=29158 RepID=F0V488_MYTGA|nr:putative C1q domain containing protein MgC1q51 [Mytilus galloprovincialis]
MYYVILFCNAILLALMAMYIYENERRIKEISATHNQTGGQTLDKRVAFHARLSQHITLGASQAVIFDDVITNIGSAYDFRTGHFTSPNDGVYFFASTFLKTGSSSSLHLQMIKNNDMISKGHAASGNSESGSMNAIVSLKRGDSVIVRHHAGSSTETIQGDWSFFSGYQVY